MISISRCREHTILLFFIACWASDQRFSKSSLVQSRRVDVPDLSSPLAEKSSALIGSSLLSKSWVMNRTSSSMHMKESSLEISKDGDAGEGELLWEPGLLKVVYGLFTSPKEKYAAQLEAVLNTWGRDVPPQKLLVVGVEGLNPNVTYKLAPLCQDGHVDSDGISCKEATLLTEGHKTGADWVVILGSDNYVLPRNFEGQLRLHDAATPQILAIWGCGIPQYCEDKQGGLCGGGGYAISRAALQRMIGTHANAGQRFIEESMQTARTVCGNWSDQVTSCIARRRGVREVMLVGLHGWSICDDAREHHCGQKYRGILEQQEFAPLTFHYIGPEEMYEIHKFKQDIDASKNDNVLIQFSVVRGDGQRVDDDAAPAVKDKDWLVMYEQQRQEYIHTMSDAMTEGIHNYTRNHSTQHPL